MRETLIDFLAGGVTVSYLVAWLLFLRFWRRTSDRLFLYFAIAFALFAANQIATSLLDLSVERRGFAYILRVLGYALILFAIVRKNTLDRRKP